MKNTILICALVFSLSFSPCGLKAEEKGSCRNFIAGLFLTGSLIVGAGAGLSIHQKSMEYERAKREAMFSSRLIMMPMTALDREIGNSLAEILAHDLVPRPDYDIETILIAMGVVGVLGSGMVLLPENRPVKPENESEGKEAQDDPFDPCI